MLPAHITRTIDVPDPDKLTMYLEFTYREYDLLMGFLTTGLCQDQAFIEDLVGLLGFEDASETERRISS